MSEAAGSALGFIQLIGGEKIRLCKADEHHLGNALAGLNGVGFAAVIDERGFDLSPVVLIDDANGV